ncbi:amidophosphoribosyltransferase [Desulfosarcina ovata subsp. sediminis]|uniref:Amidophosphoribosyltransferase n=1 Tax=Desulfosarcina ovata subsp. sediminis TaxID=885957 RepID=A0A5K8A294_9BACT|nr:ComF family protein [Desulfosarcina ovata]BBO86662.1 amidophosphoribosyltransferase [Desulfosarcina ovata subsp. sediminis]
MGGPVVRRWLFSAIDAFFPFCCRRCGHLFLRGGSQRPATDRAVADPDLSQALADQFCPVCRQRWTAVSSPFCSRCGLVFKSREGDNHLCGRCLERPGAFARARALGIYDETLRSAIHALKFRGIVALAAPLGDLLLDVFRRHWEPGEIDLVAPVPLYRRRFRQRGFNQAYLLIRHWNLPTGGTIVRDLLVRRRATAPQTGMDRRQRRRNIKNAFGVRQPGQAAGKRVLLVDDVLTTGATADACARTLLQDGAERVDLLTLARAL